MRDGHPWRLAELGLTDRAIRERYAEGFRIEEASETP